MKFPFFTKEFWMQRVDKPLLRWVEVLDFVITFLIVIGFCIWTFFAGVEWNKTYGYEDEISLLSISLTPEVISGYSLSQTGLVTTSSNSIRVYRVPANTIIKQDSASSRRIFISDSYQVENIQPNYNLDYYATYVFNTLDDEYIVLTDSWVYTIRSGFIFDDYVPSTPTATPSPTVTPPPEIPDLPDGSDKYYLLIIFLLGGLLLWNFATRSPN